MEASQGQPGGRAEELKDRSLAAPAPGRNAPVNALPDPNLPWPIPLRGVELIAESETLGLKAYRCPAGVWTIGWGETDDVHPGDTCTKEQADNWLCDDLTGRAKTIKELCTHEPGENELAAMLSLAYNIGVPAFKSSTVLRLHNANKHQASAQAFGLWNKAHDRNTGELVVFDGLTARRAKESALYLTPDDYAPQALPQAVAEQPALVASPTMGTSTVATGVGGVTLVLSTFKDLGSQLTSTAKEWGADLGFTPLQMLAGILLAVGLIVAYRRWKQRQEGLA